MDCVMMLRKGGHWHLSSTNCVPDLVMDDGNSMKGKQPPGWERVGGMLAQAWAALGSAGSGETGPHPCGWDLTVCPENEVFGGPRPWKGGG